MKLLAALSLAYLASYSGCFGLSVSLTAKTDTSIYQNNPDNNLGAATLVAGTNQRQSRSRALFRFDVSGIPAGSMITDAAVRLSVVLLPDIDQHGGPLSSEFAIYRMQVDWGEGNGSAKTGSPAQPGDATWFARMYPDTLWGSPGAESGTDYANNSSSSTFVQGVGNYTFESTQFLIADVQSWVDAPAANFGFILISQDEGSAGTARRWASLEQLSGGFAPTLDVTYLALPEPSISLLTLSGMLVFGSRVRCRSRRTKTPAFKA